MTVGWLRNRKLLLALAALAVLLAVRLSGLGDLLSLDTLRLHRAWLTGMVAAHWGIAALAFVAVYTASTALSVPGAVLLTITGGFLFGVTAGAALTVIGATTGATLVFLFARQVFGDRALDRFGDSAARIGAGIQRNAWSYMLVLRFVPLFPFFLVNLAAAFFGVRLPVFLVTTAFGIIPGTVVFTLAGAGLGSVLDAGGPLELRSILTPEILAGLIGLGAIALLAIPLKRRFAGP